VTIYLVRHGLAAAGVEDLDPGLSDLGHQQALATAGALRNARSPRLVVSPLRRTRETAHPIEKLLGLEPEVRDEVAEVFDPSMAAEERARMLAPFMAGKWSDQSETLRSWRRRCVDAILEFGLEANARDSDLVVVSHYIAICVVIGAATGDDRVVPVQVANCSITTFEAGHGELTLVEAGSTAHLPPELVTGARSALPGRG
jgi:broad specificity phosphatase PhoE